MRVNGTSIKQPAGEKGEAMFGGMAKECRNLLYPVIN
jgi:hypothetical protein